MASNSLGLALDGEVTIAALARAAQGFQEVLEALAVEVGANAPIRWVVTGLEAGSATLECEGVSEIEDDPAIPVVVDAYRTMGANMEQGRVDQVPPPVLAKVDQLTAILNGEVHRLRFTADTEEFSVGPSPSVDMPPLATADPPYFEDHGEVTGRIDVMGRRNTKWFALYDHLDDRRVRCEVPDDLADDMPEAWKHLITVRGMIRRDAATGRPILVKVERIEFHEPPDKGAWRRALRTVRTGRDSPTSDEAIDRSRDA